MKAVEIYKYGQPSEAFRIIEKPVPNIKSDEVLVEVEGFGLNFADVMARKGLYKDAPNLPFVPGYDVVGIIAQVGDTVDDRWIGKRIVGMTRFGGYAQQAAAKLATIAEIPANMPLATALTLATQYVTAYYAMEELCKFRKGDTILIHSAAGGVGLALVELAKHKELNIIATAGSDEKVAFLKSIDVTAINYRTQNYPTEVEKLVGSKSLKASFNAVGGKSFKQDLKLLHAGGTVILYGASARTKGGKGILPTLKLLFDFGLVIPIALMMRSVSINGINMLKLADRNPAHIQTMLNEVIDLVSAKAIEPTEGKMYAIDEINQAHLDLENRHSIGKLGVSWK
ncbi:MAG: NADPH:quinone reductase-like Zn-dependent oxidoreductase [Flavobacteriales bacterium]|jgi:NADPH:quinone reductase-like Zn-dependent oxidoreductase